LFHFDDKKHISYYHASSALQDYLSWEWLLYEGTIQIPLSVKKSSVFKACYYKFYRLALAIKFDQFLVLCMLKASPQLQWCIRTSHACENDRACFFS
jgi:hypothetical protein